jgi:hypothetical protein
MDTDGSAEGAIKRGGAGIYIEMKNDIKIEYNYKSELQT